MSETNKPTKTEVTPKPVTRGELVALLQRVANVWPNMNLLGPEFPDEIKETLKRAKQPEPITPKLELLARDIMDNFRSAAYSGLRVCNASMGLDPRFTQSHISTSPVEIKIVEEQASGAECLLERKKFMPTSERWKAWVTVPDVIEAMRKIARGEVEIDPRIRKTVIIQLAEEEYGAAADIDTDDCIIQVAFYGSLIWG